MKKQNASLQKIFITLIFLISTNLNAQTMETNIQGLVIKNYLCYLTSTVMGDLVNRNSESFIGTLRVKIIDKENDILWQGIQRMNVGAQNGASFRVPVAVGNCMAPNKVQITLER